MAETLRPRRVNIERGPRVASPPWAAGFAFLDAPGGSQVPDEVGEAIARALREASANLGAGYAPAAGSRRSSRPAEADAARFLGCDPQEIIFGAEHDHAGLHALAHRRAAISRPATRSWSPRSTTTAASPRGSSWPHDRDLVRPARRAARRHARSTSTTCSASSRERTRVVAFAWASNAVGTIIDAARVCELAHSVGALAWIDAVHYAAHEPIDVRRSTPTCCICSPYKFCGPHLGMAYGRAEVLETWRPYKARPAPTAPLGPPLRDRHAAVRAARRLQRDDRLPGLDRRLRGDRPLRALARRALPRRRSPTR